MLYILHAEKENNIFRLKNIIDQETGENLTFNEFINLNGIIYVNNLNITFTEIIKKLMNSGFKNVYKATKKKQFSFIYKSGECLNIKIIKENEEILTIVNFEKKFLQDFTNYETNKKLLYYAMLNERNSNSLGIDAFNEFLQMHFKVKGHKINLNACKNIFRHTNNYPIIKDPMLEDAKHYVSGFQFIKSGLYENIYNYDICSSFPSQLCNDTPVGLPKTNYKTIEEIPQSYFYVVKFSALDIKLKSNKIDFLNCDNKNIEIFTLTKHLFLLFLENYKFTKLKIKRILAFKTRKNVFNDFIYKNIIKGKIQADFKPIIKYNKAIANSIVGYFGKNQTTTQTKIVKIKGKMALNSRVIKNEYVYLPLYLFVNGKAKKEFIQTLQSIGTQNIIYANTDGFFTNKQISLKKLNFGRSEDLGAYKQKNTFKKIYIDCINGYCGEYENGEIDNTISGMRTPEKLSVNQYKSKHYDYLINNINNNLDIEELTITK